MSFQKSTLFSPFLRLALSASVLSSFIAFFPASAVSAPKQAPAKRANQKIAPPQLVVQGDKPYQLSSVVVSNDGHWVVTDGMKLFDGRAGLYWGKLPSSAGRRPLRFTPDNTRLVTTRASDWLNGEQSPVYLCAVPSGKLLRKFAVQSFPVWCDNTRLRGISGNKIIEFDLRNGKQRFARAIQEMPKGGRHAPQFAFSENGQFLVEGSTGVIRFWNATNGHLRGRIADSLRAIGLTAISNDGKWLASEGDNPKWKAPTYSATESAYARNFQLHVWNASSKKVTRTFPGYYSLYGGAHLLSFSPSATKLFAAGSDYGNVFNIPAGKEIKFIPTVGRKKATEKEATGQGLDSKAAYLAGPVHVSPNGLWLVGTYTGGSDAYHSRPVLWDVSTTRPRAVFPGSLHGVGEVKWSPDGRYLVGGDAFTLWDAKTGHLLKRNPEVYAREIDWVDAQTLRTQTLGSVSWWSVPDLKLKSEFKISRSGQTYDSDYSDGLLISPNSHFMLTPDTSFGGGHNGELWLWDLDKREVLRKIKTSKDLWGFTQLDQVLWLPDNKRIVFGTRTKLVLLNLETGQVERETDNPESPGQDAGSFAATLVPIELSPDGQWLATRTYAQGKDVVFNFATFTPNPPEGVAWWEKRKAQRLGKVSPASQANAETFPAIGDLSPDGRLFAAPAGYGGTSALQIWNVAQRRHVLNLFVASGTKPGTFEGIAVTPSGYYDAGLSAETHLRWRQGNAFWSLTRSRTKFKKPNIIKGLLDVTTTQIEK